MLRSDDAALGFGDGRKTRPAASLVDMSSVRWLGKLCGLPPVDGGLNLASVLLEHDPTGRANEYIRWWIRHPEAGSNFEKAVQHFLGMPDEAVIAVLRSKGYDGLLYGRNSEIFGHVFFQRHGAELCAFSCSISDRHRGGKLWATVAIDFVGFAAQLEGVTRARVGGGNHSITRGLVALLKRHTANLGWRVSNDGWIDFASSKS